MSGKTALELARSLRRPLHDVELLLRNSEEYGLVVEEDGRWRLSDATEAEFGDALRSFDMWFDRPESNAA